MRNSAAYDSANVPSYIHLLNSAFYAISSLHFIFRNWQFYQECQLEYCNIIINTYTLRQLVYVSVLSSPGLQQTCFVPFSRQLVKHAFPQHLWACRQNRTDKDNQMYSRLPDFHVWMVNPLLFEFETGGASNEEQKFLDDEQTGVFLLFEGTEFIATRTQFMIRENVILPLYCLFSLQR